MMFYLNALLKIRILILRMFFSNLFSNAIDPSCRNTCFKLIHGVLYTNVFLKNFKIVKSEKCTFVTPTVNIFPIFFLSVVLFLL